MDKRTSTSAVGANHPESSERTPDYLELDRMKEELCRSQDEASRARRLLLAFSQAAQAVQRARTPAEVYRKLGEQVVRLGFNAVVFSLTPDRASLTISHATFEPTLLQAAAKLTGLSRQDYRLPLSPGGFYQRILTEGQTIFTDRNRTTEIIVEGLPLPLGPLVGRLSALLKMEQGIAARLTVGGETHGILVIVGTGLTEAEVPAVTAFASQTGVALENARVEGELRKSEERYRAFTVATAQMVWITNAGGEVVVDLPSWREHTGQSEEAIKGWGWIEAVHPEDRERAAQAWKKAVEAKSPYENEFRVRKYDGSYRLLFARGIPVLEADGSIREWVGTCTDITERQRAEAELKNHREHLAELVEERTAKLKRANEALEAEIAERKRAEEALRDSEEKYRVLYESSREAIMMVAPPEWEFTAGNPAAMALFGARDEREFVAAAPWRLSPEYQPDGELSSVKSRQMIDAAMEGGSHSFEWTHKKFSGEEFFASVTLTRMIYRGQRLLQATVRDITERKRAEAEMAERHRLETLVAEVGVALTGVESLRRGLQQCAEILVRDINAAFARIWTINKEHKVLELQASAGMYTHLDGGHARVPMGQFKIGRIAENGEPHLTNTVQQDSWVGDPEWARGEGMVAFAGYPLRVGEHRLGVVAAFARQPLTPATLQAFASVADNLAQFIKRKRAEEALRETNEYLENLFNCANAPIIVWDPQFRITRFNHAFESLTGRRAQDVIGKSLEILFPPDLVESPMNLVRKTPAGERWETVEISILHLDGSLRTALWNSATIFAPDGKTPLATIAQGHDITERRQAEAALRESEAKYHALFEASADGILIADVETRMFRYANPALCRLLGYSEAELTTMGLADILPKDDLAWVVAEFEAQVRGDKTLAAGIPCLRKDRAIVYADINGVAISVDGRVCNVGFFRDITERKNAEAKLHLQSAALEAVAVGIVITDPEGTILWVNPGFTALTGYTAEEAPGQNPRLLKSGEHDQPFYKDLWDTINAGKAWHGELTNRRKDGTTYVEEMMITPVLDESGTIRNFIAMKQDVTERKRAAAALRESEAKYHALFQASADGILIADVETKMFRYVNPAACRLLGYSEAELTTMGLADIHPKDDLPRVVAEFEAQARGDKALTAGIPFLRKDRAIVYTDGSVVGLSVDGRVCIAGFFRDITERKLAEQALREAEEQFRSLFVSIPLPTFLWDLETLQYLEVNDAAASHSGYSRDELLKMRVTDLLPPEAAPGVLSQMQALGTQPRDRGQGRHRLKDGRVVDVEVDVHAMHFRGRRAALGVVQDVTERKRAEEELYQSRQMLQSILDTIPQRVFWKDRNFSYLGCNKPFAIDAGLKDPAEIIGKNDYELAWKETAELYRADDKVVMGQATPRLNFDEMQNRPDGSLWWMRTSKLPLRDREGKVIGVIGTSEDITERKQAEENLLASEKRWRSYVENAPYGIFIADEKGKYLAVNPQACSITGYDESELLAMSILDLLPRESQGEGAKHFERVMRNGTSRGKLKLLHKSGEERWWLVAAVKLSETRVLGYTDDITESKQAEEKLKLTLDDLGRSNQELEQFAYVASHDLQEPLRMVSSYTQLLARRYQGKLDAAADEFIAYAVDGANRMQRLINDLLTYSRVGTRAKPIEPTDCTAVLDQALANLKAAIEKGSAVVTHDPLPIVMADELQLVQLLQNLIGNAIKFHVEKPPCIHVSAEQKGSEWVFSVRDNGIGIDPKYVERIFVLFQRLHTREEYAGTGIGLAICKKIVERRGGRIWVESQPGMGSTFYFTIPLGGNGI